ncbi:plasmid SOS inhibition protein A [Klebsiella pneumoniae]|nr:plasmid SOS inhibition protein A [Klebsiella pneumoniae]
MRREARQVEQSWLLRQNLLGQAVTELNFQSPETVCTWYTRWSDEFDAARACSTVLALAVAIRIAEGT